MERALQGLHDTSEASWNSAFREIWNDEKLGAATEIAVCLIVPFNQLFERVNTPKDDEKVVKVLFGRMYNSVRAGLELLLSGFAQPAFTMLRDTLECLNLLELFTADPSAIKRWAAAELDGPQPKEFRPAAVRKALDSSASEADRKGRRDLYANLSGHAAHPTYQSAHVLDRDGDGILRFGPLFQSTWVVPYVEGLKIVLPRAIWTMPSLFRSMPAEFEGLLRENLRTFHTLNARYENRYAPKG